MLVTTTPSVEGRAILEYLGIVTGEAIIGTNLFRDFFANLTDMVGGRSGGYERVLAEARQTALRELSDAAAAVGANAVVGVDLDYETIGAQSSMLMVTASGTAIKLR